MNPNTRVRKVKKVTFPWEVSINEVHKELLTRFPRYGEDIDFWEHSSRSRDGPNGLYQGWPDVSYYNWHISHIDERGRIILRTPTPGWEAPIPGVDFPIPIKEGWEGLGLFYNNEIAS